MTRDEAKAKAFERYEFGEGLDWTDGFDAGWGALTAEIEEARAYISALIGERASTSRDHFALLEQWNAIVRASGSKTHGGAVGVVAAMRAERDRLVAERAETCTWINPNIVNDNYWDTGCGEVFEILSGSPDQNGLRYCCFCGRRLAEGAA